MAVAELDLPPLPEALKGGASVVLGAAGALGPRANPGLVFERYPRCWRRRAGDWDLGEGRRDFLLQFIADHRLLKPVFAPLLEARCEALGRAFPGENRTYHARGRFVTGLGADHPLDNGFTFHRHLGVPYFPGSTVKGLARAAARVEGIGQDDERRFFGSEIRRESEQRGTDQAGGVVFLEALPVAWPDLGVDLINNHRPTWTALLNSGSQVVTRAHLASAAGLEDPVPVYFLVVEPGAQIRFWIGRRPGSAVAENELDRVWEWLELGLNYLGIGAKTAVGYGRFTSEKQVAVAESTVRSTAVPAPASPGAATGRTTPAVPRLVKGDRVQFVLTRQSKKGKWQGHLAGEPDSFGTLLGEPPPDAEIGKTYEVVVGVAADLRNLNLRWR